MDTFNLHTNDVNLFINHLLSDGEVFAPHHYGDVSYRFQAVKSPDDVVLSYPRTLTSIKKYFLPPRETLLSYALDDQTFHKATLENHRRIFLGVHSYDMQAVKRLDFNFSTGNPELNYLTRRENCFFIGVSFVPDNFHFSRSIGITVEDMEGFDLYLHHHDEGFTVHVLTKNGMKLLDGFKHLSTPLELPVRHFDFKNKIKYNYNRLSEVFEHTWDSPVWGEVAEHCLGCGTCNLVCPTCYCFDVEDDPDLSLQSGNRNRTWDGCTLIGFAAVAGDENFRLTRTSRQRHRVYRKFKYITEVTGESWCVGCGRCTAYCTAGISIVDIVNRLCEEYEKEHLSPATTSGKA